MVNLRYFVVFYLALFSPEWVVARQLLNVYTYNVGLTKVAGVPIVPKVDARIPLQIYSLNRLLKRPFVLFLQEVFTSRAWKTYHHWAQEKGYWIEKKNRKSNGLVIVSSEPLGRAEFAAFQIDEIGTTRGLLRSRLHLVRTEVDLFNTHTAFSQRGRINPKHQNQLSTVSDILYGSRFPFIFGGDLNIGCNHALLEELPKHSETLWEGAFFQKLKSKCRWAGIQGGVDATLEIDNPHHAHPWTVQFIVRKMLPWLLWDMPTTDADHILVDRRRMEMISYSMELRGSRLDPDSPTLEPTSDHYCRHALVEL